MPYVVGIALSVSVVAFARLVGFDRDRPNAARLTSASSNGDFRCHGPSQRPAAPGCP
jgi:hypothetical protein